MDAIDNAYLRIHRVLFKNQIPIKIKITSKFDAYLQTVCPIIVEDPPEREYIKKGTVGQFTGIPIEIDDTIEDEYYEVVYKENNNV